MLRYKEGMERRVAAVCIFVGFLGLLSAALGVAAEAKRIKGSEVQTTSSSECLYPRSPALGLGLGAALALTIAQITINVATGCLCCRRGPRHQTNPNWTLALICFLVSWFTYVIAFLLLLTGAALNDQHGEESAYFGNYNCYVVKPGVFGGAAMLSIASVVLGVVYYVAIAPTKNNIMNNNNINHPMPNSNPNQNPTADGIAMGHPQFPPVPQNPVFVHEDTYMRRQFT
jgi:hypothetical protein